MKIKLETERLILRKPEMTDLNDLVEGVDNLNVAQYIVPIPHPYKKSDGEWFINDCLKKIGERICLL